MTAAELLLIVVKASYLVAATLFLLGLQRMASPLTARSGIRWAGLGMVIATVATLFLPGLHNLGLIVAAATIGIALTGFWGKKGAITDLPDTQSVGEGRGGEERCVLGGGRIINKNKKIKIT